jgi:hypothetical protein
MKILMSQTEPGSVDGIRTAVYAAGVKYDLSATDGERLLAAAFVAAGMAEHFAADAALSDVGNGAASDDGDEAAAGPTDSPSQSSDMNKAEMQATLTEKGIAFPVAANKAALQALLDAAE